MSGIHIGTTKKDLAKRARKIVRLYTRQRNPQTLKQIACVVNLSSERVRKILESKGYTAKDSGKRRQAPSGVLSGPTGWQKTAASRFGVTVNYYCSVPVEARKKFQQQRSNASRFLLADAPSVQMWQLTLKQWWDAWQLSGKWDQRGRGGESYKLWRKDTNRAFTVDNIVIERTKDIKKMECLRKPVRNREPGSNRLTPRIVRKAVR